MCPLSFIPLNFLQRSVRIITLNPLIPEFFEILNQQFCYDLRKNILQTFYCSKCKKSAESCINAPQLICTDLCKFVTI